MVFCCQKLGKHRFFPEASRQNIVGYMDSVSMKMVVLLNADIKCNIIFIELFYLSILNYC